MTSRRMNWVFGFLQGMYWTSYCVMFPFLVRMCASFGYDDFQSGVVLTGATIANLIMQPVVGSVCDKLLHIKPLFVAMFLSGSVISLLLPVGKKHFIILLATVLLLSACIQTLQYIIDIWSVRISMTGVQYNYGFSRSFGSVFYAVTALVFGPALDAWGMDIITPVFIVCCLITVIVTFFVDEKEAAELLKTQRGSANGKKKQSVPFTRAVAMLLRNKKYLFFLSSYSIVQIGNLPIFNYTARKFEILGGGGTLYGLALFFMAMSEVPMLLLLNKLRARMRAQKLVMLSLFGMVLRAVGIAFAGQPLLMALSFLLQSISYGIFIGAMIIYMSEIVPEEILFTAQTVFAAVSMGLSGVFGNLIGGYVANTHGVVFMMQAFVGFVAAGCLLFAGSAVWDNKKS